MTMYVTGGGGDDLNTTSGLHTGFLLSVAFSKGNVWFLLQLIHAILTRTDEIPR